MTSDIKDIASALAWVIQRLGHDDGCSKKATEDDPHIYGPCTCDMEKVLSAVQHGTDYGGY